jgi:hypothetical protein
VLHEHVDGGHHSFHPTEAIEIATAS